MFFQDSRLPAPEKLVYNSSSRIKFRHYGLTIERLIEAAASYEDGQDKDVLIKMIANHMKKTYVAWNQKSVNDTIIISDLYKISQGRLNLAEETKLMHVAVALPPQNHNKKPSNFKKSPSGTNPKNNGGAKTNNYKKR